MKLDIYSIVGDTYTPRGTITISYDRISRIDLYFPSSFAVRFSVEREAHYDWCEKTGERFVTHHIYQRETDFKFSIKKLSKAEIPYRKAALTHQVLSNDLINYIDRSQLYTKLKWWQALRLKYSSNKFVWQTKEFKKHIYFHIGTNIASALLGIFGTLLFFKGCHKEQVQSDTQSTVIAGDTLKKINPLPLENKSGGEPANISDSLKSIYDSISSKQ